MAAIRVPQIETGRLLLRGPCSGDVARWAAYVDDPDYSRYLPKRTATPLQRAELTFAGIAHAWEQDPPSDIAWAIAHKTDGQVIGWSAAGPSGGTGEVELVYMLGKPYWGQGFATEAAEAVVRYGFEHRAWDQISAAIIPGNVASRRVLEHLGFVNERDVNYLEMSGDATIQMDSPMVPYFVLRRDQFVPRGAFYRVRNGFV